MGIVLVLIGQAIQQDTITPNSSCGVGTISNSTSLPCRRSNATKHGLDTVTPKDFTYPLLVYLVVGVTALLAMAALFRPKYKRLEMEGRAALLAKLQHDEDATPASSVASLPSAKGTTAAAQFRMGVSSGQTNLTSTEF